MSTKSISRKSIALKTLASIALNGDPEGKLLFIGDIPIWKARKDHWEDLKNISFRELYQTMKDLDESQRPKKSFEEIASEAENEVENEVTFQKEEMNQVQKESKMKKSKYTTEQLSTATSTLLNHESFQAGASLSKKDLQSQTSLEEDLLSEVLVSLRTEGRVKSGKGRGAKWERVS